MRSITLHNNADGHDKIYVLEITQAEIGNAFSHIVTARWGRRDGAYGSYGISPYAQSSVKLSGASLPSALAYVSSKQAAKQSRGYRVVARCDTVFRVAQNAPASAPSVVGAASEEQRERLAAMIPPPVFPATQNGRTISADYPVSAAFPITSAFLAAVQAAILTGDLANVRAVNVPGATLSQFVNWHRMVIARWEGAQATAPVAPVAPVQSRRSLGAVRAWATRRRRREQGYYANRPARQAARPATQSDDCGRNPVVAGAICAADYWKR